MADEAGLTYVQVRPSDFYMDKFRAKIKLAEVFEEASGKGGSLICFEDAKFLFSYYDSLDLNAVIREYIRDNAYSDVYVIAITSSPNELDPSILCNGCFDTRCYISLPNYGMRKMLFAQFMKSLPIADDIDYRELARVSNGYSCADIENVVIESSRMMFDTSLMRGVSEPLPLTRRTMLRVIGHSSPSAMARRKESYNEKYSDFENKMYNLK